MTASDVGEACPICFFVLVAGIWLISGLTIAGNILAILAFASDKNIRSKVSNYFILNLSISDLLIGLLVLPLNNMVIYHGHWPYGRVVCKIWLTFVYACTTLSAFALMLISWDRFMWVRSPLRYIHGQTKKRAVVLFATTALLVYAFVIVVDVNWERLSGVGHNNYSVMCETEGIHSVAYALVSVTFELALPVGLLVTFNLLVFLKIPKVLLSRKITESGTIVLRSRGGKQPTSNSGPPGSGGIVDDRASSSCGANTAGNELAAAAGRSSPKTRGLRRTQPGSHAYRKSAVMLGAMTTAFAVCWSPWFVVVFLSAVGGESLVTSQLLHGASYVLFANSAVSPFLYALTNVRYRARMAALLCLCRRI